MPDAKSDSASDTDPSSSTSARWVGPLEWALVGLALSISLLTVASAGLVLLPIFLPISVLTLLLIEHRQPGASFSLLGAMLGVDVFAAWLAAAPPCTAPTLTRLADGTMLLGCAQEESLIFLLVGAVVATALIGGLIWARRAGRARAGD